jgi:hypothetical protein
VFCVARVSGRIVTVLVRVIWAHAVEERKAASITQSFAWLGRSMRRQPVAEGGMLISDDWPKMMTTALLHVPVLSLRLTALKIPPYLLA